MILPNCFICARAVLEIDGQFAKFEGYLLDDHDPSDTPTGTCHATCLTESPWGSFWAERRKRHYITVLRHAQIAETSSHSLFYDRRNREWLVVGTNGDCLAWPAQAKLSPRQTDAGWFFAVEHEYNLELPYRPALIAELQSALTDVKRYVLPRLFDQLQITDRMRYLEALQDGAFIFDRSLRRYWSAQALSARVRYAYFVPREVFEWTRQFELGR